MVFITKHHFVIKNKSNQLVISEDSFTDKSVDNEEGFDNVIWENGTFRRIEPNWNSLPNYEMYNLSVEDLGKIILEDFQSIYEAENSKYLDVTSGSYNRTFAHTYIDQYSSNPTSTGTCNGGSVYKNNSIWNSAYTKYDFDCANYVSQALRKGGLPTDSTWYKDSYAWRITSDTGTNKGLLQWITSKGYASKASSIYSLSSGDIA